MALNETYHYGNLICGQWVLGQGAPFETVNPARPEEVVGRYEAASSAEVSEAITAAQIAQRGWRDVPSVERGAIVAKFVSAIESTAGELARSITKEQGKPFGESRAEVFRSCQEAKFMIGEASRAHGCVPASARKGVRNMVIRRPRGLIVAITPWNFPILTPLRKIAPALIFGNAVVLKASELTPSTACLLGDLSRGIIPDGLLQIVNGRAEVGRLLISRPEVHGISFTGSVPTGKAIYAAAAQNLAEVSLELGGKNAVVINDVQDLGECLDQITDAAFMCAGQRCTAISRVLVNRPLLTRVVSGLVDRARRYKLGDGMDKSTTMGPLISEAQLARVDRMVKAGRAEGARLVAGGRPFRPEGLEQGYFYEPTVLSDVAPTMSVAREEIFGPVISVLAYNSVDEALTTLNGVSFGLSSALFSNDNRLVQRFIDESESGMIHVNHGTTPDAHMPFGGIKNSGVGGYSVGRSAASFYTTEHSVYLKH
jgi:alpha-ketoglutaric semialdehyde dehydrogenase